MRSNRFAGLLILVCWQFAFLPAIANADEAEVHPLAIHMQHWLAGSGQWRTPNPNYDPDAEPMTGPWIKEFGVNWKWAPNGQHLVGELLSIPANGEPIESWAMYTFHIPATDRVLNIQVGRNGDYVSAEEELRLEATPYGEPEVLDGVLYSPNGSMTLSRHSNVFTDMHTQLSDVYEKDESGKWALARTWRWTLVD